MQERKEGEIGPNRPKNRGNQTAYGPFANEVWFCYNKRTSHYVCYTPSLCFPIDFFFFTYFSLGNSLLWFNSIFSTLSLFFLLLELSEVFFWLFLAFFIEEFNGRGDSPRFRVLWLDLSCIELVLRLVDVELLMWSPSALWGSFNYCSIGPLSYEFNGL